MDSKSKKNKSGEDHSAKSPNYLVLIVVSIIIVTFAIGGAGVVAGFQGVIKDFKKEKVLNEDGTYSIKEDAPINQNQDNPNTYVGKILGERITLYNLLPKIEYLKYITQIGPQQKYEYARRIFNDEINKIIAIYDAKKLGITVSAKSQYFLKEIAKRYFTKDGEVDYDAMKENMTEVNKYTKDVKKDLIFEIFERDMFGGLPVSKEEIWEKYKLDETRITLRFIKVSNDDFTTEDIEKYFNSNKDKFKKYKFTRIIFDEKADAEKTLEEIKADPAKFTEITDKLKSEDMTEKALVAPSQGYQFINLTSPDSDLKDPVQEEIDNALKTTKNKNVYEKVIESEYGYLIIYVEDNVISNINDANDISKIRMIYKNNNIEILNKKAKENADKIYKAALEKSYAEAAEQYKLTIKNAINPVKFMETNYNEYPDLIFDFDKQEDVDFMVSLFKAEIQDVIAPKKVDNGYIIASVFDKSTVSREDFEGLYDMLIERYADYKTNEIKEDYFKQERKKHTIIDNYKYVFTPEMFKGN